MASVFTGLALVFGALYAFAAVESVFASPNCDQTEHLVVHRETGVESCLDPDITLSLDDFEIVEYRSPAVVEVGA